MAEVCAQLPATCVMMDIDAMLRPSDMIDRDEWYESTDDSQKQEYLEMSPREGDDCIPSSDRDEMLSPPTARRPGIVFSCTRHERRNSVDELSSSPTDVIVQSLVSDPSAARGHDCKEGVHSRIEVEGGCLGSIRCQHCGRDILTHQPNEMMLCKRRFIEDYIKQIYQESKARHIIDKITRFKDWPRRSSQSGPTSQISGASIPVCRPQGNTLPIRSTMGTLKIMPDKSWKERIPRGDSASKSKEPPIGWCTAKDRRKEKEQEQDSRAGLLDSLRARYDDDLQKIVLHLPPLRYEDVRRHVPKSLNEKNLLRSWMIDSVNSSLERVHELYESSKAASESNVVDVLGIYERFCQNRDPPADSVVEQSSCIGLSVAYNYQSESPVYISLFMWPWGQWICPVDPQLDQDYINRATLQDILTRAAVLGIPVVHAEPGLTCCLSQVLTHITADTCFPDFVQVERDMASVHAAIWQNFGIDMISWNSYKDYSRLLEVIPKNPIFASFFPKWKLRWEQMAKISCDSLACIYLFEHHIRMLCASKANQATPMLAQK